VSSYSCSSADRMRLLVENDHNCGLSVVVRVSRAPPMGGPIPPRRLNTA
jgi:hypothetical protein